MSDDSRTLAQFFFEVGFGACFAEVMIRNGMKAPFELTDRDVERQWAISQEAYEDPAELDARKALSDAAPELLALAKRFRDFARSGQSFMYPLGSLQELDAALAKLEPRS